MKESKEKIKYNIPKKFLPNKRYAKIMYQAWVNYEKEKPIRDLMIKVAIYQLTGEKK